MISLKKLYENLNECEQSILLTTLIRGDLLIIESSLLTIEHSLKKIFSDSSLAPNITPIYPLLRHKPTLFILNPLDPLTLSLTQYDSFMMRVTYPHTASTFLNHLTPSSIEPLDNLPLLDKITAIHCDPELLTYISTLAEKTYHHHEIKQGVTLQGCQDLLLLSQAHAFIHDRDYVSPSDIASLISRVFSHRMVVQEQFSLKDFFNTLLETTPLP